MAEAEGFSRGSREYCGHGIGRVYHEDPQILHYGESDTGLEMRPGMVFTIEPMINAGKRHVRVLEDGWTVVTKDHSLSAQWEHMVLVTATGHEVLTLSPCEPQPRAPSRTALTRTARRPRLAVPDTIPDTAPDSALEDICPVIPPAPLDWPLGNRLPTLLAESQWRRRTPCRRLLTQAQEELRVRFFEDEPVEGLVLRPRARFIDVLLRMRCVESAPGCRPGVPPGAGGCRWIRPR